MIKKLFLSILFLLLMFSAIAVNAATVDDLEYEITDGEVTITGCDDSASGELVIPEYIEGCPVTEIGFSAFSGCYNLINIVIPDSVTYIDNGAFSSCQSLTNITIPDSVTYIDNGAFSSCRSLTNITIPDSVTHIGIDAFGGCSGLQEVIIGNGVITIDHDAFSSCQSLTNITIPDSVTYIGIGAFGSCTDLKEVVIGNGVGTIEVDAFRRCENLKSIIIPDSVTYIAMGAFDGCSGLQEVTIGKGVSCIDEGVFSGCTSLKRIDVDENNTVYEVIDSVLCSKNNKTLLVFPEGLIDSHVVIPDGITGIGFRAFYGCQNLTSITISDSVTYIDLQAFMDCTGLKEVIIGNGVTYINYDAFAYCDNLKTVYKPISATWEYDFGEDVEIITTCKVTYILDGEEIGTETVIQGENANLLDNPEYSYFVNDNVWSGENITDNVNVTVIKKLPEYTVTFTGAYKGEQNVIKGENAVLPKAPNGCKYIFTADGEEWSGENITGNVTVNTEISIIDTEMETVLFRKDGNQYYYAVNIKAAENINAFLVVAVYDNDGKMLGKDVQELSLNDTESLAIGSAYADGTPEKYRIFLWSDLNTLIPLKTVTVESIN